MIHDVGEKRAIVTNQQDRPVGVSEIVLQLARRLQIKVIRWLVQK